MATGADRPARRRRVATLPTDHLLAGIAFVTGAAVAAPALADNLHLTASASLTETYTTNANVGFSNQGPAEPDWVTSASAALGINASGARFKLNGSIAATGLFYARTTENNSFAPSVSLTGNLEAIEKFLYIDAQVNVSQTFNSPFGAQPGNLVNATANRYTSQTYSVSPYIQGHFGGTNLSYQVRDDNIWTIASSFGNGTTIDGQAGNASISTPNTYLNRLYGSITSPIAPLGWTAEYTRTHYAPTGDDITGTYTIQVGRVIATDQVDPTLQVSLRGGYESDRFPFTSSEGPVYGAGARWSPTDRTLVDGYWEHRFFGSSYSVQISHRLPRTAISANFARGLNTYPQNALSIPAGANVAGFVDAAFTTRIPDPAERALAVQQFLAQTGLPATLATPVNIFAASIQLQDSASASVVLIGVRNSLAFNVFYLKSNAISGTGSVLPPALQFGQNNTQTGGGVSLSHQLTGFTSLTASATYSTTTSNASEGLFADARSTNAYANLGLGTRLGPKTTASAGVGYTRFVPSGEATTTNSSAVNAYAGINHTF